MPVVGHEANHTQNTLTLLNFTLALLRRLPRSPWFPGLVSVRLTLYPEQSCLMLLRLFEVIVSTRYASPRFVVYSY